MARKVQRKPTGKLTSPRRCFIISPIAEESSIARKHADRVLRDIIRPVLTRLDYDGRRIDQSGDGGSITQAIIDRLQQSRLCIAILTGLNPNVMYEAGVRHAWDLPLIALAEKESTRLPFDVQDHNTVFYSLKNRQLMARAVRELTKRVRNIDAKIDAVTSRQPPRMLPSFGDVMCALGKRYSLDALFVGKANALKLLMERVRNVRKEIEKDFESGNSKSRPLKRHATVLMEEFDALATKVSVFEGIAEDSRHANSPQHHCDGILARMKHLQLDGWRLCKRLKEASGTSADFVMARGEIDALLAKCQEIFLNTK